MSRSAKSLSRVGVAVAAVAALTLTACVPEKSAAPGLNFDEGHR